jgi:type I restriction enzyme, S subunit
MPEQSANLKPGWRRVKFGDVVRLSKARSQDPLADGFERYVGLEHLEPGDLRIRSWGNVADGVTFTSVFRPGQVLFGKRRAYQRKVAVADFAGVCSGDIYVLETKDAQVLLPELLPFICQTDAFFDHAVGTSAGSLSPRTNWTSLADFKFTLPPVPEQLRLLSALSEVMKTVSVIEDCIVATSELKKSIGLKVFGSKKNLHPLEEFVSESMYGARFSNSLYSESGSIAQLRTTDISESGVIDYKGIPLADLDLEDMKTHLLKRGDLVFSRSGTCGITSVFEEHVVPTIPAAFLIRFRLKRGLNPYFLNEFFHSPIGRQMSASLARGGVQKNINASELVKQLIPAPPIEIQEDAISQLQSLATTMDNFEARRSQLLGIAKAMQEKMIEDGADVY